MAGGSREPQALPPCEAPDKGTTGHCCFDSWTTESKPQYIAQASIGTTLSLSSHQPTGFSRVNIGAVY